MNILMVTTSYPLTPKSSSGIFVKRLKVALDDLSNVRVVCPDDSESKPVESGVYRSRYFFKKWQLLAHQPGGIPSAIRRDPRFLFLVPLLLLSMVVSISRQIYSSDLILANWAINAIIASGPSLLFRKPMITVFRGEDVRNLDGGLQTIIVWVALRVSDAVVLVSKDMKAPLVKHFPRFESKLRVIPNGVESVYLDANIAAENNSENELKVLTVASLIPRKNIITLIKAFAYLKKTLRTSVKIKLDIVGDGELRSELADLTSREGLGSDVRFHGMLAPNKLVKMFSTTQLFVLPSLYEGRPNVVVEAMAAGCCVLVSDIGGCTELVSNGVNGLVFPAMDEKILGEKIEEVASDSSLRSCLGKSARQYVIDHKLTWEGCADQYYHLFGEFRNEGRR